MQKSKLGPLEPLRFPGSSRSHGAHTLRRGTGSRQRAHLSDEAPLVGASSSSRSVGCMCSRGASPAGYSGRCRTRRWRWAARPLRVRERARRTVDQRLLLRMPRLAAASFPLIAALSPTAALVGEARLSPRSINSAFAVLREWIPQVHAHPARVLPPTRTATGGSPSTRLSAGNASRSDARPTSACSRPSLWPPWCARAPRGAHHPLPKRQRRARGAPHPGRAGRHISRRR